MSWNKGSARYYNRIIEIQDIIIQNKPDIFSLQEANIKTEDDLNQYLIPGYQMEIDSLLEKFGRARTITYIKNEIKYVRHKEMETEGEPVIWLKIIMKGNKSFWHKNYYRQWRQIDKNGAIDQTETIKSQTRRFRRITAQWAKVLQTGEEVISNSDTNIDLDRELTDKNDLEHHERAMIPLHRILVEEIFSKGAAWIKTPPTKINHNKNYANLDHMITNLPQKIIKHKILKCGASDHLILHYTRLTKNQCHFPKYKNVRDYSKINWTQVKSEIKVDHRFTVAENSLDADVACQALIETINQKLEELQPMKRIQMTKKTPGFATKETRELMNKRDAALKRAQTTRNNDDIRQHCTLKNVCHKKLSIDKKAMIRQQFQKAEGDPRKQWQTTKENLGWQRNLTPSTLCHEGKIIHDPKGIARTINITQIGKKY